MLYVKKNSTTNHILFVQWLNASNKKFGKNDILKIYTFDYIFPLICFVFFIFSKDFYFSRFGWAFQVYLILLCKKVNSYILYFHIKKFQNNFFCHKKICHFFLIFSLCFATYFCIFFLVLPHFLFLTIFGLFISTLYAWILDAIKRWPVYFYFKKCTRGILCAAIYHTEARFHFNIWVNFWEKIDDIEVYYLCSA